MTKLNEIQRKILTIVILIIVPTQTYAIVKQVEIQKIHDIFGDTYMTSEYLFLELPELINMTIPRSGTNLELFINNSYYAIVCDWRNTFELYLLSVEFSATCNKILDYSVDKLPFNASFYLYGLAYDGLSFWTIAQPYFSNSDYYPWNTTRLIQYSLSGGIISNRTLEPSSPIKDVHNGFYEPRMWVGYYNNEIIISEYNLNSNRSNSTFGFVSYNSTTFEIVENYTKIENQYYYMNLDPSGKIWAYPLNRIETKLAPGPLKGGCIFYGLDIKNLNPQFVSDVVVWGDEEHFRAVSYEYSQSPNLKHYQNRTMLEAITLTFPKGEFNEEFFKSIIGFYVWSTQEYHPIFHLVVSGIGIFVGVSLIITLVYKNKNVKPL